jgi:hypothetical protein
MRNALIVKPYHGYRSCNVILEVLIECHMPCLLPLCRAELQLSAGRCFSVLVESHCACRLVLAAEWMSALGTVKRHDPRREDGMIYHVGRHTNIGLQFRASSISLLQSRNGDEDGGEKQLWSYYGWLGFHYPDHCIFLFSALILWSKTMCTCIPRHGGCECKWMAGWTCRNFNGSLPQRACITLDSLGAISANSAFICIGE